MEYRFLGRTGMRVAVLCLGCMTFEENYSKNITQQRAFEILDAYVDMGGNFFDMADNYPGVEELFGRWLRTRSDRDQFVVASKVRFPSGKRGPNDAGLTRKHIRQAIDDCLAKTGTEYIDLYQAHCYDQFTPLEETLTAFDELIKAGKIRYAGASNFAGWHVAKACELAKSLGKAPFQSYQMQYNMLERSCETEVIPAAIDAGASINAWSPLCAGWLTGKYRRDQIPPENSRMSNAIRSLEDWEQLQSGDLATQIPHPRSIESADALAREETACRNKRRWMIIDAVCEMADAKGVSPSQVALAWLLGRPGMCSAVIGVSKLEQLRDNVGALEVALDAREVAWLDAVSQPQICYPHDFLATYGTWR